MKGNVVGVLGGMGPEATILLQQRLLATITARDDQDHLPLFIDMNPQIPSRIAHLIEGTGIDPAPTLVQMAKRLEAAGATALAMPCNTAHYYAPQITAAVHVPLLNMIDLSVEYAAQHAPRGARIGMLGSPAVERTGVFDPAMQRVGMTALWPEDTDRLLVAIREIKAHGPTPEACQILKDAASELAGTGASLLFVACSEFSLLSPNVPAIVPLIDTVDVLARAIRDHTLIESS